MEWQVAYLRSVGAPLTAANLKFLDTWQRFEGGHTNNDASFNYLNTTYGNGRSINKVGVKAYRDLSEGAQAFAQTLEGNTNYRGILQGLRAGDPFKLAGRVSAGLQTWVSGSPTGNPGYADRVLGSHATPQAPTDVPDLSAAASPGLPDVSGAIAANLTPGTSPRQQLSNLVAAVAAGAAPPSGTAPAATRPTHTRAAFKPGDPIANGYQLSVGGEHETAGLAGFPARDYFAKAGAPVVAPVAGTVVRLSGHDPKAGPTQGPHGPFGWSVYLRGTDGRVYYLTHLGSRSVKVGEKLDAGSVIGTVGNYAKYGTPSHIHMGVGSR